MDIHAYGTAAPGSEASSENSPCRKDSPSVGIDLSPYEALLADSDMSEADKTALLEALWSIVSSFVQLGFGVHPVQQAEAMREDHARACGQVAKSRGTAPMRADILLSSMEAYSGGQP